jgi:hypothetical protein
MLPDPGVAVLLAWYHLTMQHQGFKTVDVSILLTPNYPAPEPPRGLVP